MYNERDQYQIGEFAKLVGPSIPQLRRYDRLQLLNPAGRSASGYRYYSSGQTGTGRVVALLRSMDMPVADIRRILAGVEETERQQLLKDHRARLEARLIEAQGLLDAVDSLANEGNLTMETAPEPTSWLHYMPHLPVTNLDRSVNYFCQALGFRLAWQTEDRKLSAMASGAIELVLLTPWEGEGAPPTQSAYVYVDDPDALCTEYEQAGATIVERVASRSNGMRDFVVSDPDGHRFVLGRGDEDALRKAAEYYGLEPHEITAEPDWL